MSAQFSEVIAQSEFQMKGVSVPRTLTFENKTVQLNGLGIRSKLWTDVYVQALYLTDLSPDAQAILDSDTEMAIRLEITSSMVSSGTLTRKMNAGFENSLGADLEKFQSRIDLFKTFLTEKVIQKDVYIFFYNTTDTSVWVYKNDILKGKVPGLDFKKAFFGIWLSDKPADENLKNDLLGK